MEKDKINTKNSFVSLLERRFVKEMPRIRSEIRVYEARLKKDQLNTSPKIAPQFNR